MAPRVAILGAGRIGLELYRKVRDERWDVPFVLDIDGMYKDPTKKERIGNPEDYKTRLDSVDLGMLTISTLDNGEIAFIFIKNFLERNIPIVTSKKGAMSNYPSELESAVNNGQIGYSATAGGGTMLLRYVKERVNLNVEEIHAVVNGTLNYIFTGLSEGRGLVEVVDEARRLGYTEPGASNPLDVINKEATGDVPMKTSILFNICNLTKERMRARDVETHKIEPFELEKLIKEAANRRYIVSITRKENNEEDTLWGFKHQVDDWYISAGFRHIEHNPLFRRLVPSGADNAVLISVGQNGRDGRYTLSGNGAGPGPTTDAMMIDAKNILKHSF